VCAAVSSAPAISVANLRKRYGSAEVVRGIDFEVSSGECYGFLGPNGAGKTTTIEILEGYRSRSEGEVSVLGVDPARPSRGWRQRVGLVLQECELDPLLTVRETVGLFSSFYGDPRPVDETVEMVGLSEMGGVRAGRLSGGQRRRLDVGVALVGRPELVFLDEPTTGFDPSARRDAWTMIEGLKAEGTTVFLTTHYLDEAQHLADRVAILRAGTIVAAGRPDELGGEQRVSLVSFRLPDGVDAEELSGRLGARVEMSATVATLRAPDAQEALWRLTTWAHDDGLRLEGLEVHRPTLEDVFLDLTADARE